MTGGRTSLRQLARIVGVSERAVRKALARGVFTSASIVRDRVGRPSVIDSSCAVTEWAARPVRRRAAPRPAALTVSAADGKVQFKIARAAGCEPLVFTLAASAAAALARDIGEAATAAELQGVFGRADVCTQQNDGGRILRWKQ